MKEGQREGTRELKRGKGGDKGGERERGQTAKEKREKELNRWRYRESEREGGGADKGGERGVRES